MPVITPMTSPQVANKNPRSRPCGKPMVSKISPMAAAVPCPPAKPVSISWPKDLGTFTPSPFTVSQAAMSPTVTSPKMIIQTTIPSRAAGLMLWRNDLLGRSSNSPEKITAISKPGHACRFRTTACPFQLSRNMWTSRVVLVFSMAY